MSDAYLLAVVDVGAINTAQHSLDQIPSPPLATSVGFAGNLEDLLRRAQKHPDQTSWAKHLFLYSHTDVPQLPSCKGLRWYEMDKLRVAFIAQSKDVHACLTTAWGDVEHTLTQFVSLTRKEPHAQIIEWYNEHEEIRNAFTHRRKGKTRLAPVQLSAGLEAPGFVFGLQQWPHAYSGEITTKKTGDGDMLWIEFEKMEKN